MAEEEVDREDRSEGREDRGEPRAQFIGAEEAAREADEEVGEGRVGFLPGGEEGEELREGWDSRDANGSDLIQAQGLGNGDGQGGGEIQRDQSGNSRAATQIGSHEGGIVSLLPRLYSGWARSERARRRTDRVGVGRRGRTVPERFAWYSFVAASAGVSSTTWGQDRVRPSSKERVISRRPTADEGGPGVAKVGRKLAAD